MDDQTFDAAAYGRRRGLSTRAISEIVGISTMMLGRAFKEHDVEHNRDAWLHKNPPEQKRVIQQVWLIFSGRASPEDFAMVRGYAYLYDSETLGRQVYVRADGVSLPYIAAIHPLPGDGNKVR